MRKTALIFRGAVRYIGTIYAESCVIGKKRTVDFEGFQGYRHQRLAGAGRALSSAEGEAPGMRFGGACNTSLVTIQHEV